MEVTLVPSVDGLPAGDLHVYRYMDEEEREAVFLDSLVRILRDCAEAPPEEPASDVRSGPS